MAYNLTTLKTTLQNLLPSNSRIQISVHRTVNDKILDYLYLPFGIPFPCLSATIPDNCHKCDGFLLNIADYPYLFDAIGTLYLNHGTLGGYTNGDGITTFNLPFIAPGANIVQSGTDATSGTVFTLGASAGAVKHTLDITETPAHAHYMFSEGSSRTNNISDEAARDKTVARQATGTGDGNSDYVIFTNDDVATRGKTSTVGGSQAHNIMQPYIVGN